MESWKLKHSLIILNIRQADIWQIDANCVFNQEMESWVKT